MLFDDKIDSQLQNYYNEKKYEESINFLLNRVNSSSTDEFASKIYLQICKIFYYQNNFYEAEKYCLKSIKHLAKNENALIYYGLILEKKNQIIESIKVFKTLYNISDKYNHVSFKILDLVEKIEKKDPLNLNFNFKELDVPKISILILCYNKIEYTRKCLISLFQNTNYKNYEVVIVDNASIDETPDYLECYGSKIKFLHSEENLGFVNGNNFASKAADGDFLVFLNNDTEPQKNWLKNLYKTFQTYNDAGATGSMLIYPNGKLQEAGGIIFNDATGWNFGRFQNINDSKFNFVREVDYCSGASLMIRKELFTEIGGFDTTFAPAYYEDTDLCFSVRKFGYKVYYNPFSQVVHHEGITAGTDLNSGFKKYQLINKPKFIKKWHSALKLQYSPNSKLIYEFSNRKKGKRILIIDDIPPLPDRAAGALRHYHTLKQMINLGYQITYVHLMGRQYNDKSGIKYLDEFKMLGVEFIWFNYEYWWSFRKTKQADDVIDSLIKNLDLHLRNFDHIYIAFWYIADYFIDKIKRIIPKVPILVDTMDVHFLREKRQAELSKNSKMLKEAENTKKNELELYSKADCITTVTENDRLELKKYLPNKAIFILTDVHDPKETIHTFNERKDLLFVGNFNHTPNEDAVIYFVNSIFPLIKTKIKDCKFYIVGNNPTEKVKNLQSNDIIVTGWVPEVKDFIEKCRIEVVPLRYGAGNKGKVGEALSSGIPIVTTTIGAEGMGIIHGKHAYISDAAEKFAENVIDLYQNEGIWKEFSKNGKELIASQYSSELMKKRLNYIFSYNTIESLKTEKALNFPNPFDTSIIIPFYNQIEMTKNCIQSILKNKSNNYELIIIDDCSSEKINLDFVSGAKYIKNMSNLGFPKSINAGIINSKGDYILIANNDIVLTENWLSRMIEVAESDPQIGIVGPVSNMVSGIQLDKNAKYNSIKEMHKYAAKIAVENKGKIQEFPRVAFLCTLIKKEVIDKIGGLDERFSPGNFEDDDFCLRAQIAGYKTVIAKDVFIHHYGSKSFTADGLDKYKERLEINKQIFVNKWGADPEEIWLKNKSIPRRSINYPINQNNFTQAFERSLILLEDKDYNEAVVELQKAIEFINEKDPVKYSAITEEELVNLTATTFFELGNIEQANKFFEKELQINPSSSRACFGLAETFYIAELYEQAKAMYEWAIKNGKNDEAAWNKLRLVNKQLNLDENNNSLDLVNIQELLQRAEEYINDDDFENALDLLDKILGTDENNIDALNDLSVIFILQNEIESALNVINKVIDLDSENEIAKNNLQVLENKIKASAVN